MTDKIRIQYFMNLLLCTEVLNYFGFTENRNLTNIFV
jgi:hypothetical protein